MMLCLVCLNVDSKDIYFTQSMPLTSISKTYVKDETRGDRWAKPRDSDRCYPAATTVQLGQKQQRRVLPTCTLYRVNAAPQLQYVLWCALVWAR